MKKLPAFPFYPGDWLRDAIARLSLAAQGLWLRLMILMHDSERYGHLCQNGSPIPPEQLARHCGCSLVEFESLLAELESAGVPSRTRDGIIYSRRMVRDAEERKKATERKRRERGPSNGHADVTPMSRQSHTASSSSSSNSAKAGAAAPGSAKAANVIWDVGVSLLVGAGVTERSARSFLGGLIKEFGEEAVADAVAKASLKRPADPRQFLVGLLREKPTDVDPFYGRVKYHQAPVVGGAR